MRSTKFLEQGLLPASKSLGVWTLSLHHPTAQAAAATMQTAHSPEGRTASGRPLHSFPTALWKTIPDPVIVFQGFIKSPPPLGTDLVVKSRWGCSPGHVREALCHLKRGGVWLTRLLESTFKRHTPQASSWAFLIPGRSIQEEKSSEFSSGCKDKTDS